MSEFSCDVLNAFDLRLVEYGEERVVHLPVPLAHKSEQARIWPVWTCKHGSIVNATSYYFVPCDAVNDSGTLSTWQRVMSLIHFSERVAVALEKGHRGPFFRYLGGSTYQYSVWAVATGYGSPLVEIELWHTAFDYRGRWVHAGVRRWNGGWGWRVPRLLIEWYGECFGDDPPLMSYSANYYAFYHTWEAFVANVKEVDPCVALY